MSCDVVGLPFKAHTNYGTWSIDFDSDYLKLIVKQIAAYGPNI